MIDYTIKFAKRLRFYKLPKAEEKRNKVLLKCAMFFPPIICPRRAVLFKKSPQLTVFID